MGTVPFSNPAGNNQTNPVAKLLPPPTKGGSDNSGAVTGGASINNGNPFTFQNPSPTPGTPGSSAPTGTNPSGTSVPFSPGASSTSSAQNGFITSGTDAGQNALQKQLDDIYGQGVGGSLFTLLNNMSGTDSTILQEYIQSLQPQMATAKANTNAALGAGGVSANSSVAAIADSNLQSQEFSAIAGESANLTQSQEQLTASILAGTEGASAKEVATSGWSVLGDVLSAVGSDAGGILKGIGSLNASSNSGGGSTPTSNYASPGEDTGDSDSPFS